MSSAGVLWHRRAKWRIHQLAPSSSTVLTPSDLTYLGVAYLPNDDQPNGLRFGYGTGAMSGRRVGADLHLYVSGANYETGWNDPVYECLYAGVGSRMSVVQNWGDVTLGTPIYRPCAGSPVSKNLRGLWWDDSTSQLWWSYQDGYGSNWNPCFGTTYLVNGSPPTITPYGCWRPGTASQLCGGYMYPLPARAVTALSGKTMASGMPYSSIDSGSTFGAFASAWALPANGTATDTGSDGGHITIATKDLIYSNQTYKQPRPNDTDYCGWTHYGEADAYGDQPQLNPTQDGTGCTPHGLLCGAPYGTPTFGDASVWLPGDQMGSAWWIEGTKKQGVLYFGQICRTLADYASEYGTYGKCHCWYGPAQNYPQHLCSHGQIDQRYAEGTGNAATTQMSTLWIYDPADLLAVANNTKAATAVVPVTDSYDMSQLPYSGGGAFPQLATSWSYPWGSSYAGCWFDPTSKLLFLSQVKGEWNGEWRPAIHVFSVNC